MRRPDGSTKCAKGLHDWVEENIYTEPGGKRTCRPCKTEARKKKPEDRHRLGANYCHRGHEFTPENTKKQARMVNGVKKISRTCRACLRSSANGYYSTGVNNR